MDEDFRKVEGYKAAPNDVDYDYDVLSKIANYPFLLLTNKGTLKV